MPDIDIRRILVSFLAIVISITVHEFAHALAADRLGDDTPRRHGRLTLNPVVLFRAYPFGSLVVPLIGAFTGFLAGWAATPINPAGVRRGISMRKAEIIITAAGPLSNGLLAIVSLGLFAGFLATQAAWAEPFVYLAQYLVLANVFLMIFNFVPLPPLDGFHIIKALLPGDGGPVVRVLEQYGLLFLVVFIVYAGRIFGPVRTFVFAALDWAAALVS